MCIRSKKILYLVNISRTDISSAQTREFHETTKLIEELKSSVHGIGEIYLFTDK